MRLVDNFDRVLKYSWSIRWIAITCLFSGLEVFFSIFSTNINEPGYIDLIWFSVPIGTFAAFAAVTSSLAAVSRIIVQEKVSGDKT